jgi:fatty-acyl-CoA synthase
VADRPGTLPELLAALADSDRQVVFPREGAVLPHRELPARARSVAAALRDAGVERGDVVGLLLPTGPQWLPAFFGVSLNGAAVAALPLPPVVLDPEAVAGQLEPIVAAAGLRHVVAAGVGRAVATALARLRPGLVVVEAASVPAAQFTGVPVRPEDRAVVQFSSGSTARPKGVVLTHRAVLAGVSAINAHISTVPGDVLVAWVPLFHDMGLVGLLSSLLTPNDAHLLSPAAFLRDPGAVLEHIAKVGGSIVTGPNFSYERFAEAARGRELPLSRWRLAFNGAETVRPDTVAEFERVFGPMGVAPSVMYPCYGMAEATLAITLPRPGAVPRMLTVDRDRTEVGRPVPFSAAGRPLAGVGVPVPGMDVAITDLAGTLLPDGWLGEIRIHGPAVTSGYLNGDSLPAGGWLRTGDLGFFDGGELFIAGSLKEMIVVQGRNFFPEDIEDAVRTLDVVHRRHCVAVVHPLGERMVVVAETGRRSPETTAAVRGAVQSTLGLSAVDVVLVPPRSLPRTTSGKWQRTRVADLIREHLSAALA